MAACELLAEHAAVLRERLAFASGRSDRARAHSSDSSVCAHQSCRLPKCGQRQTGLQARRTPRVDALWTCHCRGPECAVDRRMTPSSVERGEVACRNAANRSLSVSSSAVEFPRLRFTHPKGPSGLLPPKAGRNTFVEGDPNLFWGRSPQPVRREVFRRELASAGRQQSC
jgi:hypothetical protein